MVQHIDREGPDLVAEIALEQGMVIHTIRPDQGEPLPDPISTKNTIAVLLGGPMSVGERHQDGMAWMQRELDWLALWHQQNNPVLGICLGAQLLAVAAGGAVQPLRVGLPPQPLKEVGYGAIHWLMKPSSEPLLMGLQPSEMVLHWHGARIQPSNSTLAGFIPALPRTSLPYWLECHWLAMSYGTNDKKSQAMDSRRPQLHRERNGAGWTQTITTR